MVVITQNYHKLLISRSFLKSCSRAIRIVQPELFRHIPVASGESGAGTRKLYEKGVVNS